MAYHHALIKAAAYGKWVIEQKQALAEAKERGRCKVAQRGIKGATCMPGGAQMQENSPTGALDAPKWKLMAPLERAVKMLPEAPKYVPQIPKTPPGGPECQNIPKRAALLFWACKMLSGSPMMSLGPFVCIYLLQTCP
ncbi:hypothetical protein SISNIDRAFT_471672 [Sistotremastrum niveocremeum HHB9708]|uniref:Uncharacterized protein n=1 Tax=Sistotremastrum niveocremeum HHB9708 TaxID=1314777 RepID=A0A164MCK5_9AGAM|nr:hypothetical protein SISNIDRAFT_471672 [Sistotremastrum niveocremeum HHB9708]